MSALETAAGVLMNSQIGQKALDAWIIAEEKAARVGRNMRRTHDDLVDLIPHSVKRGYANAAEACEDLATAVGYRTIGLDGKTE